MLGSTKLFKNTHLPYKVTFGVLSDQNDYGLCLAQIKKNQISLD